MKWLLYWILAIVACGFAYMIGRSHGLDLEEPYSNTNVENEVRISDRLEFESSGISDLGRFGESDMGANNCQLASEVAELEIELRKLNKEHERIRVQQKY